MPAMQSWDPHVQRAVKTIQGAFPVKGSTYPGHQPRMSLAADFMCSKGVGDKLANWARQNAKSLGIEYIIWYRRIWNIKRDNEGWRAYHGTPNPHTDHVHISFLPASQVGNTGSVTDPGTATTNSSLDATGSSDSEMTISQFFTNLANPHTHYRVLLILVGILLIIIGLYRVSNVNAVKIAKGVMS